LVCAVKKNGRFHDLDCTRPLANFAVHKELASINVGAINVGSIVFVDGNAQGASSVTLLHSIRNSARHPVTHTMRNKTGAHDEKQQHVKYARCYTNASWQEKASAA
jgi:hypothetical protein